MPEYPDITIYVEALEQQRILGETLRDVSLKSPFLLRTVEPPMGRFVGGQAAAVERVGKRIAIAFEPSSPGEEFWQTVRCRVC